MSIWTVRATIGGDTFDQQRDPEFEPTLPCLYSVQWSHELDLDSDDAWPVPDALTTATVTVLVAAASDAASWDSSTVVHLEFLADEPAATVVDSFSGRGSFPTIQPHPLGALITITVVSYLLDLDGFTTGGAAMPAEEVDARLNREVGWGLGGNWMDLAARPANPVTLLELIRETLSYGLAGSSGVPPLPTDWDQQQLVANVDAAGALDPVFPWGISELARSTFSSGPLVLRENPDDPGTWELWADPDEPATADVVIDANDVYLDAQWSRGIGRSVNTVHVIMADDSIQSASNVAAGEPVVAYTIETELTNATEGAGLAAFLLPDGDGEPSPWEASGFTVDLDATPDGWYPRPLRDVMALGRIPRHYHPEALTYFLGVVARTELAVAQGHATVTVTLERRRILSPGPPTVLTIDEVPQTIESLHDTIDNFGNSRSV